MKKSYQAVLLAALGLVAPWAAQAQSDLLLGFNDAAGPGSAQNDYVIDLGPDSQFTTTASFTINNVFDSALFSTAFSSDANYLNNVAAGIVGGSYSASHYLFQTGSFFSNFGAANLGSAVSDAEGTATGEYTSGSTTGWSANVAVDPNNPGTNPSSSVGSTSGNPMSYLNGGVVTETLYEAIGGTQLRNPTFNTMEIGTVTIDVNNNTLTFTGVQAVPEPTTYALLSGAGILAFFMRRKISK